ncbi:MAG: hypothetical protein CM1200mP29_03800 [Verrucomicrobiota bacterium]|nr:MAG: hypothetical protein CM1200mP29_03800 [Verrucomicrobiota bacterium]
MKLLKASRTGLRFFPPQWRTQELATRVVVGSGQSVMMGVCLSASSDYCRVGFPILGNLPGIGAIFRKRSTVDKPRYLLIFVTATLVDENGSFVSYEQPGEERPTPVNPPKSLPTPGQRLSLRPRPAKPAGGK